ncbi:unnamed protein product, partial [Amoebophrya sp. A25]
NTNVEELAFSLLNVTGYASLHLIRRTSATLELHNPPPGRKCIELNGPHFIQIP